MQYVYGFASFILCFKNVLCYVLCLLPSVRCFDTVYYPLPSNGHHCSNGDCLEGKRENYQVCSVQYCGQQSCTVQCTHI